MIDRETGILVGPGDPMAVTEALELLINDRALRDRLGAAGRKRAALDFDSRKTADLIVDTYRSALAS